MPVDEFREILDEYFASTRELVDSAERLLLEMEEQGGAPAPERVQELRRTFHTLKGNSSMMGIEPVAAIAHTMESLLKAAGSGIDLIDEDVIGLLLSGVGLIAEVARSGVAPEESPAAWRPVLAELERAAREPARAARPARAPASAQPLGDDAELSRRYLGARAKSVKVAEKSLDAMLDLAGELHVLLAGLRQRAIARADSSDESAALAADIERIESSHRLLESEIFAARLVPIGAVLSRFKRLVRDLAASQGKEIDVVLSGEGTTVDKAVVDELAEPLLHLVRNAVDHGIETPNERRAAGKKRAGRITLAARQAGTLVEVAVLDDGRGLALERIRRKAKERGIAADGLDETALLSLIFLPAFSTRDEVTALSGRGVGLDVVKASLESFGGSVAVQTREGRGTEFRLRFPLTLAVGHGLLLEVDGETFALPMASVLETVAVDDESRADVSLRGAIEWKGDLLPAVDAGRLFGTAGEGQGRRLAVVLSGAGRKKALLVDRALGHQDLVVKPLDDVLGKPFGISGATLLGDGRIVMIVDARPVLEAGPGMPLGAGAPS